mgnify:CR=1 FL=1
MSRTLLSLALALVFSGAQATDPSAGMSPAASAPTTATTKPLEGKEAEAARRELDELRTQMRDLGRRMADLSLRLGDAGPRAYAFRYLGDPDRGLIGVVLGSDEHGVKITGVTPGGPADKAGVKTGDVIVSIDGKPVDATQGAKAPDMDKAIEPLHQLKIGQDVKLGLLRDGKKTETTVKAERREARGWERMFGDGGPDGRDLRMEMRRARQAIQAHRPEFEHAQRMANGFHTFHVRTPWWGLNLASLDKDLGAYFGTDSGVLVVHAEEDTFPGLKSGDVLQAIGEEKIGDPRDAMRVLRDAPAGSELKLKVLRQKKPVTVSMKAPDAKTLFPPLPPLGPDMPEPPLAPDAPDAPPAPPAPPAAPPPGVNHGRPAAPPAPPVPPSGSDDARAPAA